jgi:SAM-dependent MidA family methyltransferase
MAQSTPLGEKIKALIRASGPISVTDYFALCLADPQYGYYKTREPFGTSGDFITAPEVSQMFGEIIGIFMVQAWQTHERPDSVRLAEIGPGRGTMMADMLRVIARTAPDLYAGLTIHLVETSPRLREMQAKTLAQHEGRISWHDSFDELPDGFTLLAANELFDAIPLRQFVKTETGFRERLVGLDAEDNLTFTVGAAPLDKALLPDDARARPYGTVFEISPARQSVMMTICERLKSFGGTALIIDYGHLVSGFGDTLQAVRMHEFDPPLAHPGEADLTSHVDFEHLVRTAAAAGVHINGMAHQGEFLVSLGLRERAAALGRDKSPAIQQDIMNAVARLAGEGEGCMGELFKVLAVSFPIAGLRPFSRPD